MPKIKLIFLLVLLMISYQEQKELPFQQYLNSRLQIQINKINADIYCADAACLWENTIDGIKQISILSSESKREITEFYLSLLNSYEDVYEFSVIVNEKISPLLFKPNHRTKICKAILENLQKSRISIASTYKQSSLDSTSN